MKKPLLQELSESDGPPPFPVQWRLSWDEKGNRTTCTIYAQTAFEAWRATVTVHHKPFSEVECNLL